MPAMDDITSLPLTPSLLNFYREKLRDNARQSTSAFNDSVDRLLPELEHMHRLEESLSSSFTTIKSFESENHDLRALLSQVIEENVRLKLKQNVDQTDTSLSVRLLKSLTAKPTIVDNSSVISPLVERCEALESFATKTLTDLKHEKLRSQELLVQCTELQESLRYNTKQLTSELKTLQGQPSSQDWEFLKAEIESMSIEQGQNHEQIKALKAENEKLRGRISSLVNCPGPASNGTYGTAGVDNADNLEQDMSRLQNKLSALERFATKFMPDDRVNGVPEFFHTIEKTKGRLSDIEQRLARRRRERR